MSHLALAGRDLGPGRPCFVIAEAGVNHNGDLELARRLVDAAKKAGADAVKFQSFHAESLAAPGAPKAAYQKGATDPAESQLAMLRRLELPAAAQRELSARCAEAGIVFLSSPFDEASADLLDALDVPAFKVPSGELTNLPFLDYLARKGRPLLISTGMATLGEVEAAVCTARAAGNDRLALLHCVSSYPAEPVDVNLRAMATMAAAFGAPVGFSDHTLGIEIALAAVALGAAIVEKHLTLDRSLPGPDHRASLAPDDFAALVRGVRAVEAALGHGRKEPTAAEAETAAAARRSVVAARDLPAGATLTAGDVALRRPGTGLPPALLPRVIGRTTAAALAAGEPLRWELLG